MKLSDFKLTAQDFGKFGRGLQRPECVWVDRDGIWTSDLRGGVAHASDNSEPKILGSGITEPNGFSRRPDGTFVVAGIGDGGLYLIGQDGKTRRILDSFNGKPLGAVNYAWAEGPDRIWLSVMTRKPHWYDALMTTVRDGYILRVDNDGARCEIVADGLDLTNEVKVSPDGLYLYAVETLGSRIVRYPLRSDSSLGKREIVGPGSLGRGALPDGFASDSFGNIWVTIITENALFVIDRKGDVHNVYHDMNEKAVETLARGIEQRNGTVEHLAACVSSNGPLNLPTSLAFGGPGGRTVYVGSLGADYLPTFQLPEALE